MWSRSQFVSLPLQVWQYAAAKDYIRVLLEIAANASVDEKKRR